MEDNEKKSEEINSVQLYCYQSFLGFGCWCCYQNLLCRHQILLGCFDNT